jgi:hypothetical protein
VFSTTELESGVKMTVLWKLVELQDRFSFGSLGKTCFRCIAHAGADCAASLCMWATQPGTVVMRRATEVCAICSCVLHKRTKTVSPKILRGRTTCHISPKLSTNMLHVVQTSYAVYPSVYSMFCMCYSRVNFGREAHEKSRLHKTSHLTNHISSRNRSTCTELSNKYSFNMHRVLVCIVS